MGKSKNHNKLLIFNDNTSKIESRIQRRLLQLHKDKLLPPAVYDLIRPNGSQRPRMYGLPKTHKKDVPLRPILSMTASAQHKLAKYLSYLLQPVLTRYSTHCIRDSFTFSDIIKTSNLDPLSVFLCSFDITSLFTNVPLAETIQICADALYTSEHPLAPFPRNIFVELMEMATSSVEFSFNNTMYRQTDGVAMGSPLGPTLANIFVGYYESQLFQDVATPEMYFRYMDDTFVVFNNENQCDNFLNKLNSLHPSLRFTFEKESNLRLPFLDVLVEKTSSKFLTSIYRKPTFTGQYLHWNSFSPTKRKINLISTLTHRALSICSPERLQSELDQIKSILLANGYPENSINSSIAKKTKQFYALPTLGPEKCPVYLRLPWLGFVSIRFEKQVKSAIQQCYFAVQPRVVFSTNQLLPAPQKDVLPASYKSNVIYQFSCHCDSRYVGRTSQRLQDRIKQHVSKSIRSGISSQKRILPSRDCKSSSQPLTQSLASDSSIGTHLLQNPDCAQHYDDMFSILAIGRSPFHLSALEATFIKTSNPILCRQKEFVYSLQVVH